MKKTGNYSLIELMVVIAILAVLFTAVTDYFYQNMNTSIDIAESADAFKRIELLRRKWLEFAHSSSCDAVKFSDDGKTIFSDRGKVSLKERGILFVIDDKESRVFIPEKNMKLSFSKFQDSKDDAYGVLQCIELKGKNMKNRYFRAVAHFGGEDEK